LEKEEPHMKLHVGDYIRWPCGVKSFSASEDGKVKPLEMRYEYGIVVDIASGEGAYTDVVIVYSGPNKSCSWIVCHVDDEQYNFELVSGASTRDG
jgi:hypothetical protein